MVERIMTLHLDGISLSFHFGNYDQAAGCVNIKLIAELKIHDTPSVHESELSNLTTNELSRLAGYIDDIANPMTERKDFPFVTTNYAFELLGYDNDDEETTIQTFLFRGEVNENRVYSGFRGRARNSDLCDLATQIHKYVKELQIHE